MAQTAEAMSMKNCKLEWSTNGSSWSDASGVANAVTPDGGERDSEGTPTFSGDKRILTTGKRGLMTITAKAVYTENPADLVVAAQSAYDNDTDFYLRWSPKGGSSTNKMYTSDAGRIKKPPFPGGEVGSAAAILSEIVLETPGVTVSTVA